jgi:HAD superfamily hydrolase (TIGR01509 family)
MDGTLLDSMEIYNTAIPDMMRSLGYVPRDDLYEAVRPLSGDEVLEYLQSEYGVTQTLGELGAALDRQLYDWYAFSAPPKPGVFSVVSALHERGIPMCVATATERVHVENALSRVGLLPYFRRIFTCPEEGLGKRESAFFLRAAAYLGAAPEKTVVVEDALHAIEGAKRGGFYVVAAGDKAEEVNRAAIGACADEFYDNLEDMARQLVRK